MTGSRRKLLGRTRLAENGNFDENQVRSIFWIETVVAAVAATLAAVTALCPQWIERVSGIDPDHHSGSIEWNIAIACAFSAAFFAALAHRNWRKSLAAD